MELHPAPDVYVTIYCKARSHLGQPWIIATFTKGWDSQGHVYWRNSRDQYLAGALVRQASARHDSARVVEGESGHLLDLETTEGRKSWIAAERQGTALYSERLRCHLCGDAIKRTTENLHRDLDRLAEAQRRDVSLSDYRAALR